MCVNIVDCCILAGDDEEVCRTPACIANINKNIDRANECRALVEGRDEPIERSDLPPATVDASITILSFQVMKKVVPPAGKVAKEARECVQECVSEFISFITSEASERCQVPGSLLVWTNGYRDYLWSGHFLFFLPYHSFLTAVNP